MTSLVGSLATMPFAIFHFGRATHYAVAGNLLAMPVMGFMVMPLATLSVAAMPFGLEAWPLHLLGRGIDLMLALGRAVSGLPGAVTPAPSMPVAALALMALGGLWLAIWRRRWRWLGLAPIAAGHHGGSDGAGAGPADRAGCADRGGARRRWAAALSAAAGGSFRRPRLAASGWRCARYQRGRRPRPL